MHGTHLFDPISHVMARPDIYMLLFQVEGLYPVIEYNITWNNLEFHIFKRIEFIWNLIKMVNISLFNIQKLIIKTLIISLLYYIKPIKYISFIIIFIKVFGNYIASLINFAIVVKTLTLFHIFNIAWKKSLNSIIKNLTIFI